MEQLTKQDVRDIVQSVVAQSISNLKCPSDSVLECGPIDCKERCGISIHEHRAHHELVAEVKKNRDQLYTMTSFVSKLMKDREETAKLIGETMTKMLVMAIVSGAAAGIMFYLANRLGNVGGTGNSFSGRTGIESSPKVNTP